MREAYLDDVLCRLLVTDGRFVTRFAGLRPYVEQLKTADKAADRGGCSSCQNIISVADVFAAVRSKVNSMAAIDKRDLLTMLGYDVLKIQLGSTTKNIVNRPPPA